MTEKKLKLTTPADRIKIITKRLATTTPAKKRPVSIIEPPLSDPTIRKRHRLQHPVNRILANRLEKIRTAKQNIIPVTSGLSDSDSDNDDSECKSKPETPVSIPNVSSELNLSVSSDSSIEEGEVPDSDNESQQSKDEDLQICDDTTNQHKICDNTNDEISSETDSTSSKDSEKSVENPTPSDTDSVVSPTLDKTKPSVNFNLAANTVCEYVPDPPTRRDIPVYNPTPIARQERTPTVGIPRKDILFDLWLIIRKIDQDIGKDLESSMIRRGFLRARYQR